MLFILLFFFGHWFLSLFLHSFFLHRYASHKMYSMTKGWELAFYAATWFVQGSSFLVPRAYGIMHRMHHTYSDTDKDPHSPHFFKDIFDMMWHTVIIFRSILKGENLPAPEFTREYLPAWDKLDKIGHHIMTRLVFGALYIWVYISFAPNAWWFLLLPVHFLMGPIQGAIVNWFGHKVGYSNYANGDQSRNTTPWGFIMMGELFQNNHHHARYNPNFARKWFEFDLTYIVMKGLHRLKIIRLLPVPVQA